MNKLVAVVVPLSNRDWLNEEERISLRHLDAYLKNYDRYIVIPNNMKFELAGFRRKAFNSRYFGSVLANTRLMLSAEFYEAFREYKYILIYHLDALVFSGDLKKWCEMDLDYVAPPWVRRVREEQNITGFENCGNGGFSLRKVSAFLKVIYSKRRISSEEAWRIGCGWRPKSQRLYLQPIRYLMKLEGFNRARWARVLQTWPSKTYKNEDKFWANYAQIIYPNFKISNANVGLKFGFDDAPRYCYKKNNEQLPFGCHGWHKYDREFWEPFLISALDLES